MAAQLDHHQFEKFQSLENKATNLLDQRLLFHLDKESMNFDLFNQIDIGIILNQIGIRKRIKDLLQP